MNVPNIPTRELLQNLPTKDLGRVGEGDTKELDAKTVHPNGIKFAERREKKDLFVLLLER